MNVNTLSGIIAKGKHSSQKVLNALYEDAMKVSIIAKEREPSN